MINEYTVNKNIKRHIDEMDKRPSAVADRAGIPRAAFSKIINCRRKVYAHEIMPIVYALGVSVESLFTEV